ncbi:uncharacterized protein A4U43_C09F11190 [Asparagus officinalis]|uniref:Uncharacterized protein n=1 Tax=Asparagus officinalis TaxID=4686 RepID=A0A5P1E7B0_ASPOF|nr:uncharacterized protein A4U43_C09F11190 [Asparagus officinalis]
MPFYVVHQANDDRRCGRRRLVDGRRAATGGGAAHASRVAVIGGGPAAAPSDRRGPSPARRPRYLLRRAAPPAQACGRRHPAPACWTSSPSRPPRRTPPSRACDPLPLQTSPSIAARPPPPRSTSPCSAARVLDSLLRRPGPAPPAPSSIPRPVTPRPPLRRPAGPYRVGYTAARPSWLDTAGAPVERRLSVDAVLTSAARRPQQSRVDEVRLRGGYAQCAIAFPGAIAMPGTPRWSTTTEPRARLYVRRRRVAGLSTAGRFPAQVRTTSPSGPTGTVFLEARPSGVQVHRGPAPVMGEAPAEDRGGEVIGWRRTRITGAPRPRRVVGAASALLSVRRGGLYVTKCSGRGYTCAAECRAAGAGRTRSSEEAVGNRDGARGWVGRGGWKR